MSIGDESLRIARQLRVEILGLVDDETRALVRAWSRAWSEIAAEFDAAALDVLTLDPPTMGQVRRLDRARRAVDAAHRSILDIMGGSAARITNTAGEAVDVAKLLDARQVASQLPRSLGTTAELAVRFDRVSREALDAIVERTTQQVTSTAWPLADDATEAMLRSLVRAVPAGLSPREAARRMLKAVEGAFDGGLVRALTVARTEILDAYRSAAGAQQAANADVLQGWVWSAELSSRTCPSCVAMHGTVHSLEEPGPIDHQNGRCARTPLVKPWSELGISTPEPASRMKTGPEWFAGQPEATQLAIMGPARLDALGSGRIGFADLTQRRTTTGWRASQVATPVRDLVG